MVDGYAYPDDARADMLRFVPQAAARLLDVGCGFGGFGAALKDQRSALTVHGIEVNKEAAAIASGRLDRVETGSFPDAAPTGETYDVITFLDVLEHMLDPGAAIQSAKAFLVDGGVIVASLPNVRHYTVSVPLLVRGRWDYRDLGILDRTHLRFFTKNTMCELFVGQGYEVSEIGALAVEAPRRFSRVWFALCLAGREVREEMTTIQYGIVAQPS